MKKIVIVAVVIVAVFIAAAMLVAEQPWTKAQVYHHWNATIGYSGPDYFSECVHTNAWDYTDCCVGLGLAAQYDFSLWSWYEQVAYNYGAWSYLASVGAYDDGGEDPTWEFYSTPYCSHSVNQYGYCQGSAFYSQSEPEEDGHALVITTYYPGPYLASYISISPVASSINGQSYEAFREISNHNNIIYLSANPTGGYYTIMTATSPPPIDYWDEYYS